MKTFVLTATTVLIAAAALASSSMSTVDAVAQTTTNPARVSTPLIMPQPLPVIRKIEDMDAYLEGPNFTILSDLPVPAQGAFLNSLVFDENGLVDFDRRLVTEHLSVEQARVLLSHFGREDAFETTS